MIIGAVINYFRVQWLYILLFNSNYVGVWVSNTRRAISRNCKHKRVETVVVTVSDRHQIEQTVISDTKPKGQIHLC